MFFKYISKHPRLPQRAMDAVTFTRGYVSLTGPAVDAVVSQVSSETILAFDKNVQKSGPHHVTLMTKIERKEVLDRAGNESNFENVSARFVAAGVGGANGVYFIAVIWPDGSRFRKSNGLKEKQFHITLTEKDDHNMEKGVEQVFALMKLGVKDIAFLKDNLTALTVPELEVIYDQAPDEKTFYYLSFNHPEPRFFIKQSLSQHQDWTAPYIRFGDILLQEGQYKGSMLAFSAAREYISDDDRKRKLYVEKKLRFLSGYTEWGALFTEEEQFYFSSSSDKDALSTCIAHCLKTPKMLTEEESASEVPALTMHSRERMYFPTSVEPEVAFEKLPRFFRWIIYGRLAVMSTPRNAHDIRNLSGPPFGVELFVTLTEEEPLPKEWFTVTNSESLFLPVPNYKAPTFAQVDTFIEQVVSGKSTLVHCGGGKGRAGTFVACYICACGFTTTPLAQPAFSARDAIAILRKMRPGSIETEEQEDFVSAYVSRLWKKQPDDVIPEPEDDLLVITGTLPRKPQLIVLCGLQGSGKSTFAQILETERGYHVVSQDEIGDKGAFFTELSSSLKQKREVVADRCHVTRQSRKEVLESAFKPKDTLCVYFDYPVNLCIQRADTRTNHPTIRQGRASSAVKSMAGQLEPPALPEGFSCVITVRSLPGVQKLLQRLGVVETRPPLSALKPVHTGKVDLVRFPRTRHLYNVGSATRDDLILSDREADSFLKASDDVGFVVQEKVDGANLGISVDPESLNFRVQNRSHYVNSKSQPQFQKLDQWLEAHRADLWSILVPEVNDAGRYILYGEWLVAQHSILYTKLPDVFLAFDLLDTKGSFFLSSNALMERLRGTKISSVPTRELQPLQRSKEQLLKMILEPSVFYDGPVEGIYVRRESSGRVLDRAKIVRENFICGNEHWGKRAMVKNVVTN